MQITVEMTYERLQALFELQKHPSLGEAGLKIVQALKEALEALDVKPEKKYSSMGEVAISPYVQYTPIILNPNWYDQPVVNNDYATAPTYMDELLAGANKQTEDCGVVECELNSVKGAYSYKVSALMPDGTEVSLLPKDLWNCTEDIGETKNA
jgi:hypothetical protein